MPSPVVAEIATELGNSAMRSLRTVGSVTKSILLKTVIMGLSLAPRRSRVSTTASI